MKRRMRGSREAVIALDGSFRFLPGSGRINIGSTFSFS